MDQTRGEDMCHEEPTSALDTCECSGNICRGTEKHVIHNTDTLEAP